MPFSGFAIVAVQTPLQASFASLPVVPAIPLCFRRPSLQHFVLIRFPIHPLHPFPFVSYTGSALPLTVKCCLFSLPWKCWERFTKCVHNKDHRRFVPSFRMSIQVFAHGI